MIRREYSGRCGWMGSPGELTRRDHHQTLSRKDSAMQQGECELQTVNPIMIVIIKLQRHHFTAHLQAGVREVDTPRHVEFLRWTGQTHTRAHTRKLAAHAAPALPPPTTAAGAFPASTHGHTQTRAHTQTHPQT
jgi:hypothetical protein